MGTHDWYKDAVIYEVPVRAFFDADDDGQGDFAGLTAKLDYLADLGVTALWLLPFYPSPLRDDGYDTADYLTINPSYGTLRDFRAFLREAHRRDLKVITELVLNHTSDQHPWFQRARRAKPGSSHRDFYVWTDDPDLYKEARIIFKDFEASNWSWDPVADAYYWHRFYHHQPDLNFENPDVHKALAAVVDHWFEMGVDGLRLDAVPYLFERDGTSCENLPETHDYLKELRAHIDSKFEGRMLLAEANQWPEDAVAYFGEGDECHMAFHFPVMPRMFMSLRMEDRFPIIDILEQTPPIPDNSQWALFLRNHDELTLEMVTDEERDYMYRVYTRDRRARINLGIRHRLAPLLGNDRRQIQLATALLCSLPGTPVLYYGDEIGMGDNIYLGDRNGVRTPMQWSSDRNAGFSRANPQQLYLPVVSDPEYSPEAVNVEAQQRNPNSLWWWTKRIIALRRGCEALGRGSLQFLYPDNRKVLAFLRTFEDQTVLCVANLSRTSQFVELDMRAFDGYRPVEMFGQTEFPRIGELPYLLTLGAYDFYWFSLVDESSALRSSARGDGQIPMLAIDATWDAVLGAREAIAATLPEWLAGQRWFGGKARQVTRAAIGDAVPLDRDGAVLLFVDVDYAEGMPERYLIIGGIATGERAEYLQRRRAGLVIACLRDEAVLFDAAGEPEVGRALLDAVVRNRSFKGAAGRVVGAGDRRLRKLTPADGWPDPGVMSGEQSNTSLAYGQELVLKIVRRPDEGANPDLELGRFLADTAGFAHVPPVYGSLDYTAGGRDNATVAILQGFVRNEGDAFRYTLDVLEAFIEDVATRLGSDEAPLPAEANLLALAAAPPPPEAEDAIGAYLESARLLGRRTAEMHLALASGDHEDLRPEPSTPFSQRALYQSMRALVRSTFRMLEQRHVRLPSEDVVLQRLQRLLQVPTSAARIRCHGDYHLGQVLFTGRDFVIIDFEGEPSRSLGERRIKRSPLRDVAGMIRSFHYASASALRTSGVEGVEPWCHAWYLWVASSFLGSWLEASEGAAYLPSNREQLDVLLDAHLLEKCTYEIAYEANNRPDWLDVPMEGLTRLLENL